MRSWARNDYLSLVVNLPHQPPVRVNAVSDAQAAA